MNISKNLLILYIIFSCWGAQAQECVVMLHGFARTSKSMDKIALHLGDHGYKVINISYPSIKRDLPTIAEQYVLPLAMPCINGKDKVHFVGYSMGGVISRYIIETNKIKNLGNVVLIASPVKGSHLSDIVVKNDLLRWFFGPAVRDISINSPLIKGLKHKPNYPIGIIKASQSHNPFTSLFLLKGPNDGTVTLASTHLDEAIDMVVLQANHNSVLHIKETQKQILNFLRYQKFTQ